MDGVGDLEGGAGLLRGCRTGEGDGEDTEDGRVFGSLFRLSALSSSTGRSLAFRRSCRAAEETFLTDEPAHTHMCKGWSCSADLHFLNSTCMMEQVTSSAVWIDYS